MTDKLETIVAEISVNWPRGMVEKDGDPRVLSQRFEDVIETNRRRGYYLDSWQLSQVSPTPGYQIETIIAVFKALFS